MIGSPPVVSKSTTRIETALAKVNILRNRRGQSMAEFALLLPVLLLLVLGGINVSRAVLAQSAINMAAREAARVGVEVGAQDTFDQLFVADARAREVANFWGINGEEIVFEVLEGSSLTRGQSLTVRVSYPFHLSYSPFLDRDFIWLEGTATFRIQQYKSRWP